MKTRCSQVNPKTREIIALLKRNVRVRDITKLGHSKSTVLYQKRKLFDPTAYENYLIRQAKYTLKNDLRTGGDSSS